MLDRAMEISDIGDLPLTIMLLQDPGLPAQAGHVQLGFAGRRRVLVEGHPRHVAPDAKIDVLPPRLVCRPVGFRILRHQRLRARADPVPALAMRDAAERPPAEPPDIWR